MCLHLLLPFYTSLSQDTSPCPYLPHILNSLQIPHSGSENHPLSFTPSPPRNCEASDTSRSTLSSPTHSYLPTGVMSADPPPAFSPGWQITTPTSKRHDHPCPHYSASFANLPLEVQNNIAQSLTVEEMKPLATVCRSWQPLAEQKIWQVQALVPTRIWRPMVFEWHDAVETEKEVHEWREDKLAEAWRRLNIALSNRPARAEHLRFLTMFPVRTALNETREVFNSISNTLAHLDLGHACCPDQLCGNSIIGAYLIDSQRNFPALRTLKLSLGAGWMMSLYGALQSTPELVSLEVTTLPGPAPCCPDLMFQRTCDKLEKLVLRCPNALHAAEHILRYAPKVIELETDGRVEEVLYQPKCGCHNHRREESDAGTYWGGPSRTTRQQTLSRSPSPRHYGSQRESLSVPARATDGVNRAHDHGPILAFPSLRHVTVYGESSRALRPGWVNTALQSDDREDWLPNVETLALEAHVSGTFYCTIDGDTDEFQWNPDLPTHKTLKALLIHSDPHMGSATIGVKPTDSDTGLISPWIIDIFDASKALVLLVPCASKSRSVPSTWWDRPGYGLAIRTYTEKARFSHLYHIRCSRRVVDWLLLRLPQVEYVTRGGRFDSETDVRDSDASRSPSDMIDLTYYEGKALPKNVLAGIYGQSLLDSTWTVGQRNLSLSKDGWDVLDAWQRSFM